MNLRKERRNEEKPWKHAGAEESVIGEDGKVEPGKIQALIFDQFRNGYYVVGEKVGLRNSLRIMKKRRMNWTALGLIH